MKLIILIKIVETIMNQTFNGNLIERIQKIEIDLHSTILG